MNISKQIFSVSFLLLFALFYSSAQNGPLRITVKNSENIPLPGAPVQLINMTDSLTHYAITNTEGNAFFEEIIDGIYVLNISYIGFKPVETFIHITADIRNFEFILSTDAISLGGVTITARKPLIRQEDDKMIIDPEPIAASSSSTLEVLESTPGLYVDPDGGIFISGTTPAVIYINGREQKMSQQDIASILRSLPPNSVDRIEVLRSPSTKYDAASSGGIINIILKKGLKIGRFGSANAGMNQGVYGNRHVGFSFNNSGNRSTEYINMNYSYHGRLEELNSVRVLNEAASLYQSSENHNGNHQLYTGYGINYDLSPNTSLSYDGRINGNFRKTESENTNHILSGQETTLSESNNFIDNNISFLSIQQDLGLMFKPDTTGTEIDTKLSYSFNTNNSEQDYRTEFIFPFPLEISGAGKGFQNRHFLVFQTDYTKHIPLNIKIETGLKATWQLYESRADYIIQNNGSVVADVQRTNSFKYSENISSIYLQASRKLFLDVLLKAGIRWEHTNMQGKQVIPTDTNFIVNRSDFFPYVFLSRKVLRIMGADLFGYMIYRKTIQRPGYHDLNPYIRFVDQFLYETGNPSLKPQFTDNIEINISFNDMPLFAVGRNYTKDIFSRVIYPDENQEGVIVMTSDNLGSNKETYFRGMVGIPPGGKYFFAMGAQYNLTEYRGFYENAPFEFSHGSWRFFTFHSLTLFKNTKLTVNGFMMRNGLWNLYELKPFGQLNLGLSQTFFNRKLMITLHARDIFKTMNTEFVFSQGSTYSTGDRYTDNRRIGINIRYNFGLRKKEDRNGLPGFEEPEF